MITTRKVLGNYKGCVHASWGCPHCARPCAERWERSLPRGPLPLTLNSTNHRMSRDGEKACPLVEVAVVASAAGACVQGSREMSDGRWLETRGHKFVGLI